MNTVANTAPVVAPTTVEAPKVPAKPKAPAKKTAGVKKAAAKAQPARRRAIGPELVISVVAKENPKTRGARSRFAAYRTDMTVAQYVAAVKKLGATEAMGLRDVAWDSKAGHIKLAAPKK